MALPDRPAEVSVADGVLNTSVTWVDGYGNVQLAGPAHAWEEAGVVLGSRVMVELGGSHGGHLARARRVSSFSSLAPDELGVVLDANGHHALAVDRASAASALGGAVPGTEVRVRVVG